MLKAEHVEAALKKGDSARLAADIVPLFSVGDAVLTCNDHPLGHTRIPRYARARRGVIAQQHGVFIFPDRSAVNGDKEPQHCYSVCFSMRELWGPKASERDVVYLDMFEPYLHPAADNG